MLWCGKVYLNEHYPAEEISTSIDNPPQPITNRAAYENMQMQTLFADPESFFHYTAPEILDVAHTTSLASANGTDTVIVNVKSAAAMWLTHWSPFTTSQVFILQLIQMQRQCHFYNLVDTAGVVKVTVTAVTTAL